MNNILEKDALHRNGNAYLFQGGEHGGVPISFFLSYTSPGKGPGLHTHPYEEIFVMQGGQATFTINGIMLEVREEQIVIVPAHTPHKFKNSGEEPLHLISIHPSKQVITQWLEE